MPGLVGWQPAMYPARLHQRLGRPTPATWVERRGSHLVILGYDDARVAADPKAAVLDFYEAAYRAGAERAGWDIARVTCVDGATDPLLGDGW